MRPFAILLKSYGPDFDYADRLVDSLHRHNPDGLHMFCVVPGSDLDQFAALASSTVTVMDEEPLARHLVDEPVAGLRVGYINQEIVKLAFHELDLAHNYFCVDSEAVFIRDLTVRDFIAPDGFPYTVLVEDNDLKVEPRYYEQYWRAREEHLRRMAQLVGLDDPVIRTCHGHQVFSSDVLRSFVGDFLVPRGWQYRDALAEAPYEFSWYNMWLQKSCVIPIHQREPLVKVYHHEGQHIEDVLRGITEDDLARGYLGVVVNSSFERTLASRRRGTGKTDGLAPYLSYGEVAGVLSAKVNDTLHRRLWRSR